VTGADHYEVLSLPRRFRLEASELDAAFLRLSRELHPDRFAGASEEEKVGIQRRSARVNDAYRALRDPVARAEHLLSILGVTRGEGEARCPPDLLAEVFELREEAAEGGAAAREKAHGLLVSAESTLAALLEAADAEPDEGKKRAILPRVREALDRRKFLASLVREVTDAGRG
jgi:molecular chaperone HscB